MAKVRATFLRSARSDGSLDRDQRRTPKVPSPQKRAKSTRLEHSGHGPRSLWRTVCHEGPALHRRHAHVASGPHARAPCLRRRPRAQDQRLGRPGRGGRALDHRSCRSLSLVARDWRGSMRLVGTRTLLVDDLRPTASSRMVLGRLATGSGVSTRSCSRMPAPTRRPRARSATVSSERDVTRVGQSAARHRRCISSAR